MLNGEVQNAASWWCWRLSNAIFTKRPVFAHARRSVYPSGSQASESDANSGRLQKTARPIPWHAAVTAASTLQAPSCMSAAPSLFIVMGEEGEKEKEGVAGTRAQQKQTTFGPGRKK